VVRRPRKSAGYGVGQLGSMNWEADYDPKLPRADVRRHVFECRLWVQQQTFSRTLPKRLLSSVKQTLILSEIRNIDFRKRPEATVQGSATKGCNFRQ